jgi:two-component system sensor histidine kinase PhcS
MGQDQLTIDCGGQLLDAYRKFYTTLRVRQAKVCFILAMILVPACIGLDLCVYPKLAVPMFKARLWCDLAMLPCFLALFTKWGRRHVQWVDSVPLITACIAICWMIYLAEGAASPYYAGLNIVMAAAILLIPYTLRQACAIIGFVIFCYVTTCLLHEKFPPPVVYDESVYAGTATTINNLYFLGMTALIALTSNHLNTVRRFQEFRLRYELDVNNVELASTLKRLKETEVQLVQSEKMNALGKLSAGLLHEVNNPLNFTFMALQMAEQEAGENSSLKETLADISQGMTRIRSVISDLRSFAYPSKLAEEVEFTLDEALTTARRLTAHELGTIPIDCDGIKGFTALGAKTQVVHVFMNLLINSAHAVKDKKVGREPKITVSAAPVGSRIKITVRDNGIGVPAADLPRLFEPFFTTKQPGQGTGLGLSISHTIVKNHGGAMAIASEQGQWTEVTFDLPLAVKRQEAA